MTFLAVATATTVGGARRGAHVELRTSSGGSGSATMSLPTGTADAVVSWASTHLPALLERPVEEVFDGLGVLEARWNDLSQQAGEHEKWAAGHAVTLVTDALWDLWARSNDCPLWKLIVNLAPDHLVRSLDLRVVEDVLSPSDARQLLETRVRGRSAREADLRREGYPVLPAVRLASPQGVARVESLSSGGWPTLRVELAVGADTDSVTAEVQRSLAVLRRALARGCRVIVGPERPWSPHGTAAAAALLASIGDLPIDALIEPSDGLDVVNLAALRRQLGSTNGRRLDVGAGGELDRVVSLKQLLASQAVDACRVDPGRVGVSGTLKVLLLAARLRTPVCVVAGSASAVEPVAGLQLALQLAAVDNIAIGASLDRRWIDLGTSGELLVAALNGAPGRARLPTASGRSSRSELVMEEKPLSNVAR